jgi:hypothetical protein
LSFLGGLKDEMHGAVNARRIGAQCLGRAQQHRHVAIMAAAVKAPFMAAGIGQAGLFIDGQRIHVGAQANGTGAGTMAQNAHDAGAANAFMHLQPRRAQRIGNDARRAMFGKTQFGVRMDIMAQRHQWRHQRSNICHGSVP